MMRGTVGTVVLAVLLAAPATAGTTPGGDSKVQKPIGTWTKAGGDLEVKFEFKADREGSGRWLPVQQPLGVGLEPPMEGV